MLNFLNRLIKLHPIKNDVGLIELNKHKKEDKELAGVAPTEKVEVPYLCMKNLPESVLKILIQCDRDGTYYRHDFQPFDSWDILWAGDMGAKSTKFGFFNTRQHKFLTGQNLHICSMSDEAPDSQENVSSVFSNQVGVGFSELKNSSIVRLRMLKSQKFAGALVQTKFPVVIPGLCFGNRRMNWTIQSNQTPILMMMKTTLPKKLTKLAMKSSNNK